MPVGVFHPRSFHAKVAARIVAVVVILSPSLAADDQLEKLLVAIKKLNGKVEVEKVGKTDYLTVHLSDTKVKDADLETLKGMTQIRRL